MRITILLLVAAGAAAFAATSRADLGKKFGPQRIATLSGSAETPAGDPNGAGRAQFRFDVPDGLVCFSITIRGTDPFLAAHIHKATAGSAGPIVLPLPTPQPIAPKLYASKGCVSAARSLIRDMLANSTSYYYNTHNAKFPAGVVRGQL